MPISEKSISFLYENRLQNSREWYAAHKDEYREFVYEPLASLVLALQNTINAIDPAMICDPRIGKSVSRVYRDTRFSADKSLYRNNAWIVFMRDKKLYEGLPGYFFEFGPTGFSYGFGYYSAGADSLNAARSLILKRDGAFLAAKAAYEEQNTFNFEGEKYKRTRYPDQPEDMRGWLDRKNYDFSRTSADFSLLYSDALADVLRDGFLLLEPVYKFFMKAEDSRPHKNDAV